MMRLAWVCAAVLAACSEETLEIAGDAGVAREDSSIPDAGDPPAACPPSEARVDLGKGGFVIAEPDRCGAIARNIRVVSAGATCSAAPGPLTAVDGDVLTTLTATAARVDLAGDRVLFLAVEGETTHLAVTTPPSRAVSIVAEDATDFLPHAALDAVAWTTAAGDTFLRKLDLASPAVPLGRGAPIASVAGGVLLHDGREPFPCRRLRGPLSFAPADGSAPVLLEAQATRVTALQPATGTMIIERTEDAGERSYALVHLDGTRAHLLDLPPLVEHASGECEGRFVHHELPREGDYFTQAVSSSGAAERQIRLAGAPSTVTGTIACTTFELSVLLPDQILCLKGSRGGLVRFALDGAAETIDANASTVIRAGPRTWIYDRRVEGPLLDDVFAPSELVRLDLGDVPVTTPLAAGYLVDVAPRPAGRARAHDLHAEDVRWIFYSERPESWFDRADRIRWHVRALDGTQDVPLDPATYPYRPEAVIDGGRALISSPWAKPRCDPDAARFYLEVTPR